MHNQNSRADQQFRIFCKEWTRLSQQQKDAISEIACHSPTRKHKAVLVNVASASVATITALVFGGQLDPLGAAILAVLCYFYGLVFGGFLFDRIISIKQ